MAEKYCKRVKCSAPLVKGKYESNVKFQSREYCSRECYMVDRLNKRYMNADYNKIHPFKSSIK